MCEVLVQIVAMAHVDLLVTDVGLPGLNGRQLADAARERRPNLPVLLITGSGEQRIPLANSPDPSGRALAS